MEFAIILPFLVILLFGLVDISFLLINYLKVEQAAREAARTAGRIVQMVGDVDFVDVDTCSNRELCRQPVSPQSTGGDPVNSVDPFDCAHVLIQLRVREIMRHQQLFGVGLVNEKDSFRDGPGCPGATTQVEDGAQVTTRFTPPPIGAPPGGTEDSIMVEVRAEYSGFFGRYPIDVRYRGPWLYQR